MKIKLSDVVKPITLEFLGNEEWLAPIRGSFSDIKSPLKGHLAIAPKGQGRFEISGRVSFEPKVPCSKCNDLIPWTIEEEVMVMAQKKAKSRRDEQDDIEVASEDLDIYEVPGDHLDLEVILNDIVQLGIPSRCVLMDEAEDGAEKCRVCGDIG